MFRETCTTCKKNHSKATTQIGVFVLTNCTCHYFLSRAGNDPDTVQENVKNGPLTLPKSTYALNGIIKGLDPSHTVRYVLVT